MPDLAKQHRPFTIWRITDHRAGHDKQSLGLTRAISRRIYSRIHEFSAPGLLASLINVVLPWRRFANELPAPDLIIGAGHGTHAALICAALSRGGKTVVIMQPSLPNAWFDLCLIPEHDAPNKADNVIVTKGALNTMQQSAELDPAKGLILVGGPSRHHGWDDKVVLDQIKQLVAHQDIQWTLGDSPRTPEHTSRKLTAMKRRNLQYQSCQSAPEGWLEKQMSVSAITWVTEDSISMIFEALTCGSAVGILAVPVKHEGRVVNAIRDLAAAGKVTLFKDCKNGNPLTPMSPPLNESERCAKLVLEKFNFE